MLPKVGLYHFCRWHGGWAIYQYTKVVGTYSAADFVESVPNYESAVKRMYELNNWGTPKIRRRTF